VIPFNLAAGASSAPIGVGASGTAFIIATSTTSSDYGVGSLTVVDRQGQYLDWSGEDATTSSSGAPNLEGGWGATVGKVMLKFDYDSNITLQVVDADHFAINNASTAPATGSVWILTQPPSPASSTPT
jgi:hypothetical protein